MVLNMLHRLSWVHLSHCGRKTITPWSGSKINKSKIWNRILKVFLEDLNILDLIFGFLVKNWVYSRLETSVNPQFGQTITKKKIETVCWLNLLSGLTCIQIDYIGFLSNLVKGLYNPSFKKGYMIHVNAFKEII